MMRQIGRSAFALAVMYTGVLGMPMLRAQRPVASNISLVGSTTKDAILARPVTVTLNNVSLRDALRTIARNVDVAIQYRAQVIAPVTKLVTLRAVKMPLGSVLDQILAGTNLHVVHASNGVTIVPSNVEEKAIDGGIRGTVIDAATKRPVSGATVTVEGTKTVVRTDEKGVFVLANMPAGTYTLVVRRLGYRAMRQSVSVSENSVSAIDFAVSPMATALEEVVTTVTGPQRRVELGNVVSVIRADSLVKEAPITSMSQLLASRVPGLIVSQGQGTVGGNVRLQIRGVNSLTLGSEPIVIVDGIRYSSRVFADQSNPDNGREPVSPLNDLNPNDVESVEVVKGPSAATLYGTDAANGVIVITTKRGKVGPPLWSGFVTRMTDEIPRTKEQKGLEQAYEGWGRGHYSDEHGQVIEYTVNYCTLEHIAFGECVQDSVTRKVPVPDNFSILKPAGSWMTGANVSGGQASFRYYFSGDYNDQVAALGLPDTVIRIAKRLRGVAKLPEAFLRPNGQTLLNLRSNITAAAGPRIEVTVSSGYTRGVTRSVDASFTPYTSSVREAWCADCFLENALNYFARSSTETNNRLVGSANGTAAVGSWLTGRATVGMDWANRNRHEVLGRDSTRFLNPTGSVYEGRTRQTATTANAGGTAIFRRGPLQFRTSAGGQYVRTIDDVVAATGTDLPPGTSSLSFAGTRTSDQDYGETVTLGTYLEETAALNDRLYLTAAVRSDGASGFGSGYSAAVYPKLSASWLLSQEPFLPRLPGLDELRLRAAVGVAGRQATPTMRLPRLGYTPFFDGYLGDPVLSFSDLGNPDLRPERSRETETGLDVGLFQQRVQLGLTWYQRRTSDLIVMQSLPAGYGYLSYRNVGLTREHGFEAQTTVRLLDTRPLTASVTLGHSSSKTKLVRIGDAQSFKTPSGGYAEGYPLGAIFLRPVIGVNDIDHNGIVTDGEVVFPDTGVYVGQNTPTRTKRITANLGLFQQRLRLSANFDHEAGATLLSDYLYNCGHCREAFDSTTSLMEQASRKAFNPVPLTGSFTRLREVTAAMTVPTRVTRSLRLQSSSVTLSARNLALWTHYRVPDPESVPISVTGPTAKNVPTGIPQSRTWMLRCDVTL